MSIFRYDAIDSHNNIVSGEMDAPSEAAVSIRLSHRGYSPLKITGAVQIGATKTAPAPTAVDTAQAVPDNLNKTLVSPAAVTPSPMPKPPPPIGAKPQNQPSRTLMGVDDTIGAPPVHPLAQSNSVAVASAIPNRVVGPPKITSSNKLLTARPPAIMRGEKRGPAKPKDQALFFRQLAVLVRSGLSLFDALDNLGPRTQHQGLSKTAKEMATAARTGKPISSVMERYPDLFQHHVVGAIHAGEKGGFIDIVLDEIAHEYEQEMAFYKGMWLPISLVVQQLVAVCIAQPLFPTMFPEANFKRYIFLVLFRNIPIGILLVLAFIGWWKWIHKPENDERRDRAVLRIPVFGDLARQRSLAAFIRMLRKLYYAGVGPINAWEGAMNVAPNFVIREKLTSAYDLMQKNIPLHDAFISTGLFANEMENLLATGVIAGQVVDMLDKVADYYQENVDRAFSRSKHSMYHLAITMFMVLIGITICWMAWSYFHGIFDWVAKNFEE